jgi:hypothetical protein
MPSGKNSSPRELPAIAHLEESDALERVRRGELGLEEYLEARVAKAVAPFRGRLSTANLSMLEANLRHLIRSDPVLVEMVRTLTGQTPSDIPARKN